MVESSLKHL